MISVLMLTRSIVTMKLLLSKLVCTKNSRVAAVASGYHKSKSWWHDATSFLLTLQYFLMARS
jgi:hypothetical protein